jgi:hypothetical protein
MTLPSPYRPTHRERLDLLYICRLQKLPIYNEIVRKLTLGISCRALARWLHDQRFDGCGAWSVSYWVKLLCPLDRQVQAAKERALNQARRKRYNPPPPSPEKVVEVLATMVDPQMDLARTMPNVSQQVWNRVDKTLELLTAERCAKYGFLMQLERVDKYHDDREQGAREAQVLNDITMGILKIEMVYGVPKNVATVEPVAESKIVNTMRRFNEIDRNLMRSAATKIINMIQEDAAAMHQAAELDATARTEESAEQSETEDASEV